MFTEVGELALGKDSEELAYSFLVARYLPGSTMRVTLRVLTPTILSRVLQLKDSSDESILQYAVRNTRHPDVLKILLECISECETLQESGESNSAKNSAK